MRRILFPLLVSLFTLLAARVEAIPIPFTDPSTFATAVAGLSGVFPQTLDFEGQAAGTVIPSGDSLSGITFTYALGGVELQVSDLNDTTSGTNSLGTTDAEVFQGGDAFSLSFATPTNAIGMYFITSPDEILDGDLTLTGGGVTASLSTAALVQTLGDGGQVYFLGLVDSAALLASADIGGSGPFFTFNVDDITTTVPEPTTLFLLGVGIAGLTAARRR